MSVGRSPDMMMMIGDGINDQVYWDRDRVVDGESDRTGLRVRGATRGPEKGGWVNRRGLKRGMRNGRRNCKTARKWEGI